MSTIHPVPKPTTRPTPLHRRSVPEILTELVEQNPEALTADGFEEALVGIVYRKMLAPIALYDREECIAILVKRDGMSEEEAEEYFGFNVDDAWVGEGTPAFLIR
jgi:hypothetical protein